MLICPFCKEGNFDLIGLRYHLVMCYCEVYNNTPLTDEGGPTPVAADGACAHPSARVEAVNHHVCETCGADVTPRR